MKVTLLVLAFVAAAAAAPQNWPYRDSLMPYRYGYPSQTQYKYLPQIEDDEDVGPYLASGLGRQDVVVGSDGDRVRPTTDASAPGVVETGSVAPVVEPTVAPVVQTTRAPVPPPPRPIGPGGGTRPVQPPVFPPARPPPTPPSKEPEEDEEEDDESDEEEADDEGTDNEEGDDDGAGDEDNNDEEDEEERRRQEPLNSDETVEVKPVVAADKMKPAAVSAPAPVPVVAAAPVVNKTVPPPQQVSETSVEDVVGTQVVESNEVSKPESEDESSEEQSLGGGVEALVPGYVTDQGEVLVPVDTVTGDQPISIVPDPYSPPARGVSVRGSQYRSPYEDVDYNNPYNYYPEDQFYQGLGRQDDSEEADEEPGDDGDDDEDNTDDNSNEEGSSAEGRNEYLTAFPPARTPELFALINSRYPGDSVEQYAQRKRYQGPYAPQRYQPYTFEQREPVIYRVRQQDNNPSVSLAVRVTGNGFTSNSNNYNPYVNRFAVQNRYPEYVDDQYSSVGHYEPEPVLRGPYTPAVYRPRPQYSPYNPYAGYGGYRPRPRPQYVPRPQYGPRPAYGGGSYHGPRPSIGGQRRPAYRPFPYTGLPTPVFIKRRPIGGSVRPVGVAYANKQPDFPVFTPFSQAGKKVTGVKRPTPVEHQDDDPYAYEPVFASYDPSQVQNDSVEPAQGKKTETPAAATANKTRRAAKMTKKMNKKTMDKKKKMTDPDPLNILKKISMKRS